MKVKTELDLKVEMGGVSHIGTGCQGYLLEGTRYEEIVRVFGQPQLGRSLDGKTKAEGLVELTGWCSRSTITSHRLSRSGYYRSLAHRRMLQETEFCSGVGEYLFTELLKFIDFC
jgi:hypothetical protein